MKTEILMPSLSPTMEEGSLAKWYVSPGDKVKPGDIIADIETDKALMEYESIEEGTIVDLVVKEGTENIKVNTFPKIRHFNNQPPLWPQKRPKVLQQI